MRKKSILLFVPLLFLVAGCEKDEEKPDLDKMVLLEEDEEAWDDPEEFFSQKDFSPQEIVIIEQPEHEIEEDGLFTKN